MDSIALGQQATDGDVIHTRDPETHRLARVQEVVAEYHRLALVRKVVAEDNAHQWAGWAALACIVFQSQHKVKCRTSSERIRTLIRTEHKKFI